jgi:two-component system chemotaxis response regulator CheB
MARKRSNQSTNPAPRCDIVVIGASAGGVEAVGNVLRAIPEDFPGAIFVVIHIPAESPSLLPVIFQRHARIKLVQEINDGESIQLGRAYIAPEDCHLILEPGRVRVVRGPKENRHRPAINPLFRSAARVYGPRVIGVILTGGLDDGADGLFAVKSFGGTTLIQDPHDAQFPEMPQNALKLVKPDYLVPLVEIPALLEKLVVRPPKTRRKAGVPVHYRIEKDIAEMKKPEYDMEHLGKPSVFACPDCHGVLWEMKEGKTTRFRCRVGHAFSLENLRAQMSDALEEALWSALRALEEKEAVLRRLANDALARGLKSTAHRFTERASELTPAGLAIRSILLNEEK